MRPCGRCTNLIRTGKVRDRHPTVDVAGRCADGKAEQYISDGKGMGL